MEVTSISGGEAFGVEKSNDGHGEASKSTKHGGARWRWWLFMVIF